MSDAYNAGYEAVARRRFTPGPWIAEEQQDSGGEYVIRPQNSPKPIAVTFPNTDESANASLLEAAPELYAIVREWVYGKGDLHRLFGPARQLLDRIDAAQSIPFSLKDGTTEGKERLIAAIREEPEVDG